MSLPSLSALRRKQRRDKVALKELKIPAMVVKMGISQLLREQAYSCVLDA
jgi:hypothetical protein